ncbi:MAG: peptidoglycan -binding protein [Alphaproteobacteria bacterium]
MAALQRRPRRTVDIWPGFVDALSTLLIIIIFVLMVFVLAQFLLSFAITGRDQTIGSLGQQVKELGDLLSLERRAADGLRLDVGRLSAELKAATAELEGMVAIRAERDDLAARLRDITVRVEAADRLAADLAEANRTIEVDKEKIKVQLDELLLLRTDIEALRALKTDLEAKVRDLGAKVSEQEGGLAKERELSKEARAHAALLNQQLEAIRQELVRLNAALAASEALNKDQKTQIASLGQRLNQALASKVEELSRYRSEFFGRLREVLGKDPRIRIDGDRFVFQSEVLFSTGSAELGEEGQAQLGRLATTLLDLTKRIPTGVNWILRVDGHTDRLPIATDRYPSNWELSSARALSVVRFLTTRGIPAERLAATGFGEYQPIDGGSDEIALRRNRRIELKLDQR